MRIFVSYKSKADPDERLALSLVDALQKREHSVFIDRFIHPGEFWAKRIEQEVRECDWLLILLSASSCQSEMVKGEIELARDQQSRSGGRPQILPVRATYRGPLPYPLGSYLDHIQHAFWDSDADTPALGATVADVVEGRGFPRVLPNAVAAAPEDHTPAPLHSARLRPPGGTIDSTDPCYVVRESERKAIEMLDHGGQTIVIKGPRQTGKSSLLNQLAAQSLEKGGRLALIDLQLFYQSVRESAEGFLGEFGRAIARSLEIDEPDDSCVASPFQLTSYFEREALNKAETPFLLAIDEADRVFGAPFQFDFFAMLRHWHNKRADPHRERKAIWRRLDLALVTATEPYMFIDTPNQSPFNVGEVVRLEDFTAEQVRDLNRRHGDPLAVAEILRLCEILGGQPYLIRRALFEVAREPQTVTPEQLLSLALEDRGPFRDHLRHHWLNLERQPKLAESLRDIVHGRPCDEESAFYRLESAGLVKRERGRAVPRCLLYGEYFRTRLR